jgi:hypothetical protein
MTNVLLRDITEKSLPNRLPSKVIFDTLEITETTKPEIGVSGFVQTRDSVQESQLSGELDTPIIATAPNFHKERGVVMSDEGFIKLPRSLLKSESWKNLRLKQQKLFLYILEKAIHTDYKYKYNGIDIPLVPGEYCVSLRRLVDDFNGTIRFKDEKIDLPFVQRAVSAFSKSGLSDTRSDTGITVIKITIPGIYDYQNTQADTRTDTDSIHLRYTNEERKEGEDKKETIDGAEALDSSLLNNLKKEEKKSPSAFQPSTQPKFTEEKKKHFEFLWKFICEHGMVEGQTPNRLPGIKEKDLTTWLGKYEGKEIMECLKMTLKAEPSKTWPGYVTKLLRDRISKKEEDSKTGKRYVQDFIKTHNLKHIDMKQDYFKDLLSQEQTYYSLPDHTLQAILKRSCERAKEREAEDKRQQEEDDKYY